MLYSSTNIQNLLVYHNIEACIHTLHHIINKKMLSYYIAVCLL